MRIEASPLRPGEPRWIVFLGRTVLGAGGVPACWLGDTLVAPNDQKALETLRNAAPIDLLFTDPVMPGGLSEVAIARRAQAIRPGLRVLLTTGYCGTEAATTDEFPIISKPFRATELSEAIFRMIGQ